MTHIYNWLSQWSKIIITVIIWLIVNNITAQAPQAFKYQAVIRNSEGAAIASSQVIIRISILDDVGSAYSMYQETHNVTTSSGGLVSLNIGEGSNPVGSFATIPWGIQQCFLKIEVKTADFPDFVHMGTSQLLSVPYAFYAKESGGAPSATWEELNATTKSRQVHHPGKMVYLTDLNQMAYYDGEKWSLIAACPPLDTVYAGEDQIKVIGTQVQLAASELKPRHQGKWSILQLNGSTNGGFFSDNTSPTATFTGRPGQSYQLIWTGFTACDSYSDTLEVSFCHSLTLASAGTDQLNILNDTSLFLAGNTPSPYNEGLWSIVSGEGGMIINPELFDTEFRGMPGETYALVWSISAECNQMSSDTLNISFCQRLMIADAGTDQLDLDSSDTQLDGNDPGDGIGLWSIISGTGGYFDNEGNHSSTSTDPNAIFWGLRGETYELKWSVSADCDQYSEDYMTIRFCPVLITANAGSDVNIACNPHILSGNEPGSGNTGKWEIISGTGGSLPADYSSGNFTELSGIPGENYTLIYIISNACGSSIDTVNIYFEPLPGIANAGQEFFTEPIASTLVNLAASNPASNETGLWTIISGEGGYFLDGINNMPNATFVGLPNTAYLLEWKITNQCQLSTSDSLSLYFCPVLPNADAGIDVNSICGPYALAGNDPGPGNTGVWSVISGTGWSFSSGYTTGPNTVLVGLPGETYELKYTISNICDSTSDNKVLSFEPLPSLAIAGSATITGPIEGTIFNLGANSPQSNETGKWSIISGTGGAFLDGNDTIPNATFIGLPNTTYMLVWTITNQCQQSTSDSLSIYFCPVLPNADAGPDLSSLCGTLELTGNDPGPGNIGVWSVITGTGWSFAPGYTSGSVTTFNGLPGEAYELKYTISNICSSSSDFKLLSFEPQPSSANAGGGIITGPIEGTMITLGASTPQSNETGKWTIISGDGGEFLNEIDTLPDATFIGLPNSTYILRWTISNQCQQSTFDYLTISFCPEFTEAIAGEDASGACLPHILSGNTPNPGGVGTWSVLAGTPPFSFCSVNNPHASFTGIRGETYQLRWTISDTCHTTWDDVIITFELLPTFANAGIDTVVVGNSYILQANTPEIGIGSWSVVSGLNGSYSFTGLNDPQATFTGVHDQSYVLVWQITNTCNEISTDTVTITFLKPFDCGDLLVDSRDDQIYPTVSIGNQCWMGKNLNVGQIVFNNQYNNPVIEKFCYDHNPDNCGIYGGLYLWDEMMSYTNNPGAQGICPVGWHIPIQAEFEVLVAFLGESAGGKLKETGNEHWTNNYNASNSSGFTALGAGMKSTFFTALKADGRFWSSNDSGTNATHLRLRATTDTTTLPTATKITGLSVRCIKD